MRTLFLIALIFLLSLGVSSQTTRQDGIDLFRTGDYANAVRILKAVTTADDNDELAWLYLGASLLKSKDTKGAAEAFLKGKAKTSEPVPGDDVAVTILTRAGPGTNSMAWRDKVTGTVKLAVEFGSDGKIGFVFPIHALPDGLTEQSIAAARKTTFTPASKGGKPVTTVAIFEYTFSIF